MRKLTTAAMAALTLAGSMAWSTGAAAEHRRYQRDRDNTGAVVAAGVLGLALGAAVASNNNGRTRYYSNGYYNQRYYADPYYGRSHYRPQRCRVVTRWDPYYDRYVSYRRCR